MTLRTSSHREARRPAVLQVFMSLLVALGSAACGGDGRDGSSAPVARPEVPEAERYGGTVVVAGRNDIASMNAFTSLDIESLQHQAHLLFVTLLKADDREQPLPYFARSWTFGEDSASVTFELERGLTWHDGEPATAQDVVFTFETMRDPAAGYPHRALFDAWLGVELLDEYTLRFTIRPAANLFYGWTRLAIMPAHILGDVPPAALATHPFGTSTPVGNGPFRFVERVPGDRWVFEANPDFPDALGGRPYVDRYVYRVIADDATQATAIRVGEVDLLPEASPASLGLFAADTAVRLISYDDSDYSFIAWNTRRSLFADPAVRRALTMAIDRPGIVAAVLEGEGMVGVGPVGPWHWAFDSTNAPLPHAPDSARAVLAAAGWTDADGDGVLERDGRPFDFTMYVTPRDTWRSVAAIVQSNLRDVGIAMEVEVREASSLQPLVTSPDRRFDAFLLTWIPDQTLDDRAMWACDQLAHPVHFSSYCNPELDAVLDSLLFVTDRAVYAGLVDRYNEILAADQPYTFLYYPPNHAAARIELRGVEMDVRGNWVSVTDWWLEPSAR
ncbi:MAG TPA: ABC transporter substrate-binding protein [Gemmatimonadota bacterium]|nr:ABC transporter substrate-binding protein [Gemmatimonadota bacterium]